MAGASPWPGPVLAQAGRGRANVRSAGVRAAAQCRDRFLLGELGELGELGQLGELRPLSPNFPRGRDGQ